MGQLEGKICLVTGASGSIGGGIAEAFAREGASLILTARSENKLLQLADRLKQDKVSVLTVAADVTDEAQVQQVFQQTVAQFQRLDILVNNAGVFDGGALDELSLETWDKVINVNLRGPFLCTREAMRIMKPQRSGRIINIGSISAQRVRTNSAAYSTSKHGLWGLTQVTALEGRTHGITCGCVHPGNTEADSLIESRRNLDEPVVKIEDWVQTVVTMAALPAHVNFLEAIVLPATQPYIGRG
jgi:NAD(P)-dependent dehydrogenase (short-subunit alcohol dehydrogenase family)